MAEKCVSSFHIQKLGHEIQEIRERALLNIISKLDHGFEFDNPLARSREILTKLFEWFLFEPCTKQDLVFGLIKHILESTSGKTLLSHHGPTPFKKEIAQIRSYIEPKYHHQLEEILQVLDRSSVFVPPLETDVPLSYRTGQSEPVGSTATPIEGFVHQDASVHQHNTPRKLDSPHSNHQIDPLKWQMLIETDRQVLQSIENSLINPPQPASLLHSAEFFSNVLLRDFPAEVFLQRPTITTAFYDLINNCTSTRVTNSVLNCLNQLTKALQVRINHYNDPCLSTSKENTQSRASTPITWSKSSLSSRSRDETERLENVDYLKTQQISFPRFCFMNFRCILKFLCVKPESIRSSGRRHNQRGINQALDLLEELLNLLNLVVGPDIWTEEAQTPQIHEIRRQMNDVLVDYGDALEFFRVEAAGDDSNLQNRVTQLCVLHNCSEFLARFVPLEQTGIILPRNLKNSLADSLVDVTLLKLYPDLYNILLNYVQSFKVGLDSDSIVKYHETKRVCDSMTSAVEFMRQYRSLNAHEGIILAEKSLPCLEFHQDLTFVKQVIDLSANKLPLYPSDDTLSETFETVILKLLGHNLETVREETYKLCQKRIIETIGPKLNKSGTGMPGSQILFLCRNKILVEIACHGLTSDNPQIRNSSENILIHLIKCKILVSGDIWDKIVEALIGSLPVLLCHVTKKESLGRSLLDITDPDTAETLFLPKSEVVKANICLLFTDESQVREEAFSRLCWLLAAQTDSKEMLPRLNNLYDKALPNVCQIQRLFDVNKNRTTQHFYQPSSLHQVLELLKSENVEPVIRRSALTQISVMMEDSLLHSTFLAHNGIEILLSVVKSALTEKNFMDYPDSVIPAVAILKNLCLFQTSARQCFAENIDVFYNVLRSLFMFFTGDKLRHDAVCLLFLLCFNEFIKGTPAKANFSVPHLISAKLHVPFVCNSHWEISNYYEASLVELLASDPSCFTSIQIQWNCEIFGGLDELLSMKRIDYDGKNIVEGLRLRQYDLAILQASSVDFYVRHHLIEVQNGTMHECVINTINKLTTYVILSKLIPKQDTFLDHPWEGTFSRFLKILPSSEDDTKLLSHVLKFLLHLAPFYKSSEKPFWLIQILKNPSTCLLDLITVEPSSSDDLKNLSQDLLNLVTLCATQEQHFLDYYNYSGSKVPQTGQTSWINVIEIISNCLKFTDSSHFYNLSYLDSLLACLVHLTASLGWSGSKPNSHPKKLLSELVSSLCELVVVFHCSKGQTATVSVMGLSITRNVILILNHLVAEMHNSKLKNWERCFLDVDENDWLKSFLVLWSSRDVLLRAGALQLFAGLAKSPMIAINIVNELKNDNHVWDLALSVLLEHEEASVVRENCAFLLANLLGHSVDSDTTMILTSLVPNTMRKGKDEVTTIFELFEDYQFYKNLVIILTRLYTLNISNFDTQSVSQVCCDDSSSSSTNSTAQTFAPVAPSLVKSLANLLLSLFNLNEERLSYKLQDFGIIKLLLKAVCNPSMSINDTKKLSLYCEIVEMDATICTLLSHVVCVNTTCLGTVLHTRDCLTVLLSLLNPKLYHTHLPQLLCLRNRLWSEIFRLLSILTSAGNFDQSALRILSETIEESGAPFVETVCEAAKSLAFDDLQTSALLSLTALSSHMQHLLDSPQNGACVAEILLNLYELCDLKASKGLVRKKSVITGALTSVLGVSHEAKKYAMGAGLPTVIVKQLKEFHLKLGLESVDCLRRVLEKKRVCPVLKDLDELVGLVTNFMVGDGSVKDKFAQLGLSDFVHKLWVWFALQNGHFVNVLKMLATFTADCVTACQSLPLTSSVAGTGPRKIPTKISLLHVIISLIDKEMEQVSRTHNLSVLELCFVILKNCCSVLECRILICKSPFLNSVGRLHPAITKKQKPWDFVESLWLEFLQIFSLYPEGQSHIAKNGEAFDLILTLTSGKLPNRTTALLVLRNIAFYQPNRSRLLTSAEFLNLLKGKLANGTREEKAAVVLTMWSLSANNQKAKIAFKAAKLDTQLEQMLKHYQLSSEVPDEEIETAKYVLSVIGDRDL
ncbi:rotatin isoform X1 [Tribolium madens]|uniref:rotatin isoform X1 n=1 Tax=Tribolium madens TaxID=41895 RepID=UPI001CF75309|nr:rotatin isoform X1 [Tribolium madens]